MRLFFIALFSFIFVLSSCSSKRKIRKAHQQVSTQTSDNIDAVVIVDTVSSKSMPSKTDSSTDNTNIVDKNRMETPQGLMGELQHYVTFKSGSLNLIPPEQESEKFKKKIETIFSDSTARLKRIFYTSSSSPEGESSFNAILAQARLDAAIDFFNREYKLNQLPGYNTPGVVVEVTIPENWKTLYYLIEESDIDRRNEIVEAMRSAPSDKERKVLLQKFIDQYTYNAYDLFKMLRYVWVTVEYEIMSSDEIQQQIRLQEDFSWPAME